MRWPGRSRGNARRASAATALLVATLGPALAGCADDPEEPDEAARTSGPLAAGFEIEPGSALLGDVFGDDDEYLRAILRVDGNMPEVFDGYVRQAQELGFPVTARWSDGQWCTDDPDRWSSYGGEETAFAVECAASGLGLDGPPYWQMRLRGLADPDGRGYLEISGGRYSGEPETLPPVEDGPVAPLTGDQVAPDQLAVYEDDPLFIVEGSELVFDPLPSECATGGWVAMLRVTGDLLPVMRGYAEQIDAMRAFDPAEVVGDERTPSVGAHAAGGGDLGAVGVAGEPPYVLIDRCND